MRILKRDTDHVVELTGLTNGQSGALIADAAVSVTLRDAAGAEIPGADWPEPGNPVPDSPGDYRATLPYTVEVKPGQWVECEVVADGGPGLRRTWHFEMQVEGMSQ